MGVSGSFLNNCNIMITILFGELILSLIVFLAGKLLKSYNIKKIGLTLLKQGFITVVLFNIFNVTFSAGIHFKYA